jgi:hypothetical protein
MQVLYRTHEEEGSIKTTEGDILFPASVCLAWGCAWRMGTSREEVWKMTAKRKKTNRVSVLLLCGRFKSFTNGAVQY